MDNLCAIKLKCNSLKPLLIFGQGDVLLSFDDIPVANEGTVPFRAGERISFGFLVSQKYVSSLRLTFFWVSLYYILKIRYIR